MQTRREVVAGGALFVSACASGKALAKDVAPQFAEIEKRLGGRLGVCAIDSGRNNRIAFRGDERFAMASTFKWALAAAVLKACESGEMLKLSLPVSYTRDQILPNSPVTEKAIDPATGKGSITIEELCRAIITVSDNCGANLLLDGMIPPEALTHFLRQTGDQFTRLDRRELELNDNTPGDPRDTTTPNAMAGSMLKIVATPDVLNAASRARMERWLVETSTGLDRLRAGLPKDWRAGDKTGTGRNGAHNAVAIIWPPGRKPIVIASYQSEGDAAPEVRAAAHADVARIIVGAWG